MPRSSTPDPSAPLRRVALYGGSFDPPHLGHVLAATWALALGRFDEVRLVPARGHAFGKALTPFDLRCALVDAAIAHLAPRVRVDPLEGDLPTPSYTIDTVRALAAREPGVAWTWVLGADAWADRRRWRAWDELERTVGWLVLGRAGAAPPLDVSPEVTLPEVSSTAARHAIASGQPVWHLLPPAVEALVAAHGLYR